MKAAKYPSYKPGLSKNISLLPEHWAELPLKRLFRLEKREPLESDEIVTAFRDGTVTLRKNKREDGFTNALKEIGYQRIHRNDLVIHAMDAFAGAIGVSDSDGKSSPVYSACTVIKDANPHFYAYYLRDLALHGFIESLAKGIRERSTDFRWSDASMVAVPVPPKGEQLAITNFLDRETAKIDALIAEQQRLIELLQEKRQAVISHAVTKGLNPNAPMKDSGVEWIGEVPKHWEVLELKRLNTEGSSITYGIVQAGPHQEKGVPYIRTSDMSGDRLLLETCQRTSPEIDEAYARSKVSEGDLVIAIRATVGKTLEVPKELDGANLTQGTAKFSPGERVTSGFMKLAFASSYSQAQIGSIAKGATFLEITLDALRRLAFAVPPKDEARQITHYLSERCAILDTLTTNSEEACSLLKERRSALISAAVTGQIDVRGMVTEAIEQ